jgi:hypothetical protein
MNELSLKIIKYNIYLVALKKLVRVQIYTKKDYILYYNDPKNEIRSYGVRLYVSEKMGKFFLNSEDKLNEYAKYIKKKKKSETQ